MRETKDRRVNLRISESMHEQLQAVADAQGRSVADVIRRAVAEALQGWTFQQVARR